MTTVPALLNCRENVVPFDAARHAQHRARIYGYCRTTEKQCVRMTIKRVMAGESEHDAIAAAVPAPGASVFGPGVA